MNFTIQKVRKIVQIWELYEAGLCQSNSLAKSIFYLKNSIVVGATDGCYMYSATQALNCNGTPEITVTV